MTGAIDTFDVLNAWSSIAESSVDASDLADELGVDESDVEPHLRKLVNTDAAMNVGVGNYDLTALGAIVASSPSGGRFIKPVSGNDGGRDS